MSIVVVDFPSNLFLESKFTPPTTSFLEIPDPPNEPTLKEAYNIMEIQAELSMQVDQNNTFGPPIKPEVTQIFFPLEEIKKIDPSKTLTVLGYPTLSKSNPIFAQLFDK